MLDLAKVEETGAVVKVVEVAIELNGPVSQRNEEIEKFEKRN